MDTSLFFGGSVIAAVVAGALALFAPCCISVMLPAYFATSFHNHGLRVAMTFVYAAGVATIILPLALGAAALRQVINEGHTPIYVAGGLFMVGLAIYIALGGQLHLPSPGRAANSRSGPAGVYSLGLFSGIATSCCAPVLAGVIALAGVASSFALALGLGLAYVFGMVAPLFVVALLWERFDWRSSALFRPRSVTWHLFGISRTASLAAVASAVLLAAMGAATIAVGLNGNAMELSGWQASFAVQLQSLGQTATRLLAVLPGWLVGLAVAVILGLLARRALSELGWKLQWRASGEAPPEVGSEPEQTEQEERILEHQHA
mgnify:CR=1 FL=1